MLILILFINIFIHIFYFKANLCGNNTEEEEEEEEEEGDEDIRTKSKTSHVTIDKSITINERQQNVNSLLLNEVTKLENDFTKYIEELPVIGFNSGKYDLNLVKKKLMKHLQMYENHQNKFVVKRNNNYICVSNGQLKFLDITNYLAPGCSYDKFLKAYDCSVRKSFFPYEYFDHTDKLEDTHLPSYNSFYSSLKGCNTLEMEYSSYNSLIRQGYLKDEALKKLQLKDVPKTGQENYAELLQVWIKKDMHTFRDFLVYYNNLDTEPFVEGVQKLIAYYHCEKIDIFKESITLPGVARKLLYKSVKPSIHFALFNKQNKDLYRTFRNNIIGGPSIVFSRYAEANKTSIRSHKYKSESVLCKRIIGFDSNALYLWSMSQNMPTGVMTRRRSETGFKRETSERYLLAFRWMDYIMEKEGIFIQHALNSAKERRIPPYHIDGYSATPKPTVYEFNGCWWHFHQHKDCYITKHVTDKDEIEKGKKRYERTLDRQKYIEDQGYTVIVKWECEFKKECQLNDDLAEFLERYKRPMDRLLTVSEDIIIKAVMNETLFGAVEVSIEVPKHLNEYFEEMSPLFCTTDIPMDSIGQHMQNVANELEISKEPRRLLVGGMKASKILIATPLLKWYVDHGLKITKIYQVVEFDSNEKAFLKFTDHVSDCRRKADCDPSQLIKGESQKLIGNASYGSTILNKEKHERIYYVKGMVSASKEVNSKHFKSLTELDDDFYEMTAYKRFISISLPVTVGYVILQYAKLRMLSFYYDCLDRFIDRKLFQLIQMDTDSFYIAFAGETLDELVYPHLKKEFEKEKGKWFPREHPESAKNYDKRKPGLFKEEFSGDTMVALCSKMYCIQDSKKEISKFSCKGVNKSQMLHPIDMYKRVMHTKITESKTNRGIRLKQNVLHSYSQSKASFTYFYPKRKVLDDGINTTFLDLTLTPKSHDT